MLVVVLAVGCGDEPGEPGETAGHDPVAGVFKAPDEPEPCGPPCAATWEMHGDLALSGGADLSIYECLTVVHGDLSISSNLGPERLAPFRNLQRVDGELALHAYEEPPLDLSPLACLTAVGRLKLVGLPLSGGSLPRLRSAPELYFEDLDALPSFAPDFGRVRELVLWGYYGEDLLDAGSWRGDDEVKLNIVYVSMTDLAGLEGLVTGATVTIAVSDSSLLSLHGLEPMTSVRKLALFSVHKLDDISALSGVTRAERISLTWMVHLTNHRGLHNLERVGTLRFGDCYSDGGDSPVPDLVDFDSLVEVGYLDVQLRTLVSLTGAPKLRSVGKLLLYQDAELTQAELDAFLAQLDEPPTKIDIMKCCGNSHSC